MIKKFHKDDRVIILDGVYNKNVRRNINNRGRIIDVKYDYHKNKSYSAIITDDGEELSVYNEDLDLVKCIHEET